MNDTLEDAARLIELTQGIASKINLIQFNPHEGTEFRGSDEATIGSFKEVRACVGGPCRCGCGNSSVTLCHPEGVG